MTQARTWLAVSGAALLALALRLPFVGEPSYPDEGGYLLIADQWHRGGAGLYGSLFVDRPPLLLVFWRAAASLGGIQPARLLASLLVTGLVILAGMAGHEISGRRGAVWSSLVAAALASTPALGAREVDGELLAVPLVMASCVCILLALRRLAPRARVRWAFLAGVAGAGAVLVKQNFVDGLVFAGVLVVASALRGAVTRRTAGYLLASGAVGVATVVVPTAVWASSTAAGLGGLEYVMYGFRSDATHVILSQSLSAPLARLVALVGVAVASGVGVIAVLYLACSGSRLRRRDPLTLATVGMLAVGVVGVALGASYWAHYLIGLVPVSALAAGSLGRRRLALRRITAVVVGFVVLSAATATATSSAVTYPSRVTEVGLEHLLGAAARPADTAVITYGHANVIEAAGLHPDYRYVWSLPMRVLDPRLDLMTSTLAGNAAPTWFVEWEDVNSWDVDSDGRLTGAVAAHYHRVATVCGVRVFLHNGVTRTLPTASDPCAD